VPGVKLFEMAACVPSRVLGSATINRKPTIEQIEDDGDLKLRTDSGREVEFNASGSIRISIMVMRWRATAAKARPHSAC
jgi:hypothetical protein